MRTIDKISKTLAALGCDAHYVGFQYTRKAVEMVMADPSLERRVMKNLYYEAGDGIHSIERPVRFMIQRAMEKPGYFDRAKAVAKSLGLEPEALYNPSPKRLILTLATVFGEQ